MPKPIWVKNAEHSPSQAACMSGFVNGVQLAIFIDNPDTFPRLVLAWQRETDPSEDWNVLHVFWQLSELNAQTYRHISGEIYTGTADAVCDYFGMDIVWSYLARGTEWIRNFWRDEDDAEVLAEGLEIAYKALSETKFGNQSWERK